MSSSLLQVAIFTAGAIVGGGLTVAVTRKRPRPADAIVSPAVSPPVVDIGPSGRTSISAVASVASLASPVLKYGNPGACNIYLAKCLADFFSSRPHRGPDNSESLRRCIRPQAPSPSMGGSLASNDSISSSSNTRLVDGRAFDTGLPRQIDSRPF